MTLTQFKRNPDNSTFHISFDDGMEFDVASKLLRENCPCAGCSGEEVLLYKYTPVNKEPLTEDSFVLEKGEIMPFSWNGKTGMIRGCITGIF